MWRRNESIHDTLSRDTEHLVGVERQKCSAWMEGFSIELEFGEFQGNKWESGSCILVLQDLIWLGQPRMWNDKRRMNCDKMRKNQVWLIEWLEIWSICINLCMSSRLVLQQLQSCLRRWRVYKREVICRRSCSGEKVADIDDSPGICPVGFELCAWRLLKCESGCFV